MKKGLSKILALAMAVLMVFSVAGCGSESQGEATGTNEGNAQGGGSGWAEIAKNIPENLKGTTITVYSWNDVGDVTDAQTVIEKFTNETGIKVNWVKGTYTNYATEIASKVAAKEAPDIIRLKDMNLGLMSVLQPLDDIKTFDVNDSAWDTNVKNFYSVNGKCYGINMANTLIQQPKILWYNRNLISKYELEDPYALWKKGEWSYDKFVQVCEDFIEEASSEYLAWSTYRFSDVADMMGAGAVLYKDGKFTSNMNDANLLKGWQMFAELRDKDVVNDTIYERDRFGSGKVLFFSDSTISGRRTHYYWPDLKSTGSLGCVPMPSMDGFDYLQEFTEYEAYGVPKTAKNAEAAYYFLRYYLDGANYDENTFFCDATILEVYKWCMEQKNNFINCDEVVLTEDTGLTSAVFKANMKGQKAQQVNTKLNSYKSVVDAAVQSANGRLSKIK